MDTVVNAARAHQDKGLGAGKGAWEGGGDGAFQVAGEVRGVGS